MNGKAMLRSTILSLILFGFMGTVHAQDINKAREAFNNALQVQTSDPIGAIKLVQDCLDLCGQIGEDADEIRQLAELKLPELYVNQGNQLIKAKDYPGAISAFEEAAKVAEEYNNDLAGKRAKSMLPQLHYTIGGSQYKANKLGEALTSFQKAIAVDPDYAKAYYSMGLAYKKQKNMAEFEKAMDLGLTAAKNSRDNKYLNRIKSAASKAFLAEGAKAISQSKAADAIDPLTKALKYNDKSPDVFFYMAQAHNELKQWDKAVEAANRGLGVEKDDPEKKAKHYYNLGLAYKGKGDKSAACTAMNSALFGQFKENAQYEIEHELECDK